MRKHQDKTQQLHTDHQNLEKMMKTTLFALLALIAATSNAATDQEIVATALEESATLYHSAEKAYDQAMLTYKKLAEVEQPTIIANEMSTHAKRLELSIAKLALVGPKYCLKLENTATCKYLKKGLNGLVNLHTVRHGFVNETANALSNRNADEIREVYQRYKSPMSKLQGVALLAFANILQAKSSVGLEKDISEFHQTN